MELSKEMRSLAVQTKDKWVKGKAEMLCLMLNYYYQEKITSSQMSGFFEEVENEVPHEGVDQELYDRLIAEVQTHSLEI